MNIAILGGRGIGRIHAGVFFRLGHTVSHVLGTSSTSAADAAQAIGRVTGSPPEAFTSLESLLDAGPDAVVIATPPHVHREQILAVAARRLPILCEKPMFWEHGLTCASARERLDELRLLAENHLFVSSPNASLVKAVSSRIPPPSQVSRLRFAFHTQGPHRGEQIGVDLLTHAFTVVESVLGWCTPEAITKEVSEQRFHCRIDRGGVPVELDLREGQDMEKLFEFEVDDRVFRRVQRGVEATYRVGMLDVHQGDEVGTEDPFVVSARGFIAMAEGEAAGFRRHFEASARVFEAMVRVVCARE